MQQGDDEPSTPSLSSTNNDDGDDDDNDEGAETISISPRREESRGIMVGRQSLRL